MSANRRPIRSIAVVTLLAVGAACGEPSDVESLPSPAAAAPEAAATTTTTTTSATPSTTTLPGEPFDPLYAPAGAVLGAVAIPYDAMLTLHALPGAGQPVVASLPPLATGIVSTGRAQSLGVRDGWLEVTAAGATGWAPLLNLFHIGGTTDATSRIVTLLGGTPTAPTMLELGRTVADAIASTDPEVTSRVVVVVAPTDGPTGEVTYDVVDFPDDSVAGARLRVTGRQVPAGDLPGTAFASVMVYELVSVESTALCYRGATTDGLCI